MKYISLIVLFTVAVVLPVNAVSFTTYTNYSSWLAAAGTVSLEDFTGEVSGAFSSRDFGDFAATLYNPGNSPSITTDYRLVLQTSNYLSYLEFVFDSPIVALGFDWQNTDGSSDKIEIEINGSTWIFGPAQQSGFFGIIATGGSFNNIRLGDSAGDGGALSSAYLDNFRYTSVAVPEPTSCFLLLVGAMVLFSRKFSKN